MQDDFVKQVCRATLGFADDPQVRQTP